MPESFMLATPDLSASISASNESMLEAFAAAICADNSSRKFCSCVSRELIGAMRPKSSSSQRTVSCVLDGLDPSLSKSTSVSRHSANLSGSSKYPFEQAISFSGTCVRDAGEAR